jgi:hypothetical protein
MHTLSRLEPLLAMLVYAITLPSITTNPKVRSTNKPFHS